MNDHLAQPNDHSTSNLSANESSPAFSTPTSTPSALVCFGIVTAVTMAVFVQIGHFDFVDWDDAIHVFHNPYFEDHNLSNVGYFWHHGYQELYIPLSYTLFGILSVIAHYRPGYHYDTTTDAQVDPHVFHCANLILHLVNVALVFFLLRRITRKNFPSLCGALLFAIHPLQVESVAWISELRGLLSAAFGLFALHVYLTYVDFKSRGSSSAAYWIYFASVLLGICAMLSKPSAVVLGPMIGAFAFLYCKRPLRSTLVDMLPYAAVGVVLVVITNHIQTLPSTERTPIYDRPFIAGDALAFYLSKFIVPIHLGIDYGRKPARILAHWWVYFDWLAPAAVAAAAYAVRRSIPLAAFGAVVALLALLPVLGLTPFVFQSFSTTADRYCYLAVFGAAISLSAVLATLSAPTLRKVILAVVIWLLALCVLSYRQTETWSDDASLFANAVTVNIDSPVSQAGEGLALLKANNAVDAVKHFSKAVALDPSFVMYRDQLGGAYLAEGDQVDAEKEYLTVVRSAPTYAPVHRDLGVIYIAQQKQDQAASEFATALKLDPGDYASAEYLGHYYESKRLYDQAIAVYAACLDYNSDIEPLWRGAGLDLLAENLPQQALRPLQSAHNLQPADAIVNRALADAASAQSLNQ